MSATAPTVELILAWVYANGRCRHAGKDLHQVVFTSGRYGPLRGESAEEDSDGDGHKNESEQEAPTVWGPEAMTVAPRQKVNSRKAETGH